MTFRMLALVYSDVGKYTVPVIRTYYYAWRHGRGEISMKKKAWDDIQVQYLDDDTFGWIATYRVVDSVGTNELSVVSDHSFPTMHDASEAGKAYIAEQQAKRH